MQKSIFDCCFEINKEWFELQLESNSIYFIFQGKQVYIEGDQPRSGNIIENYEPPSNPLKYADGTTVRTEEKAVNLLMELLDRFSPPNARVLDVFAGTATTALACIEMGFRFYGCEKDKECSELASERLFDIYKKLFNESNISILIIQINFQILDQ